MPAPKWTTTKPTDDSPGVLAIPMFGGEFRVYRNASGQPEAEWRGPSPAETKEWRLAFIDKHAAHVAERIEREATRGKEHVAALQLVAEHWAAQRTVVEGGPEEINPANEPGGLSVKAFVHSLPIFVNEEGEEVHPDSPSARHSHRSAGLIEAANRAPGIIRDSIRQTHPHLFEVIMNEPPPPPLAGADPF